MAEPNTDKRPSRFRGPGSFVGIRSPGYQLMYKEHFSFRELPFNKILDPKIFYLNAVYQEALATLEHGFQTKKGIILTGEAGTGKTLLVRRFLSNVASSVQPVYVVKTAFSFADSLRMTLIESGVVQQHGNNVGTLEAFQDYVTRNSQAGVVTCLIVDEAHAFDGETLEGLMQLLNLGENSTKPLQLILVGQPEFMKKLDQPVFYQLKQRVGLHCRLVPLSRTELHRYIEFHIRRAGYDGNGLFDPGALARIACYCEGIPRLVNNICDNALFAAYRYSRREIGADVIDEVAQDMGLVSQEQPHPSAFNDNRENIYITKPSSSSQVSTLGSNSQFNDREAPPAVTSPLSKIKLRGKLSTITLGVIILGVAGTATYTNEDKLYFADLKTQINSAGSEFGHIVVSPERKTEDSLPARGSATTDMSSTAQNSDQSQFEAASKETIRGGGEAGQPRSTFQEDLDREVPKEAPPVHNKPPALNPDAQRRLLEREIQKAINNRAIEGVSVNVVEGTAILTGQVASETQKAMAERAALGVQEVARVENQIEIQP